MPSRAISFALLSGCATAGLLGSLGSCKLSVQTPVDGCESCHRPSVEHGIEQAHPWRQLACTDCHGGDSAGKSIDDAHPATPQQLSGLKTMATDELDEVDPAWIRFVNPGDLRVADVGCGAQNPAGGGCHQRTVETTRRSVMSTFVGHYNVPRFLAGLQGHEAELGAYDIEDPEFEAGTHPGAVASIEALRPPEEGAERASMQALMDNYLVKSCPTCHAWSFGPNNAPGNYRSSGCTSCHMLYDNDGLSQSADPTIEGSRPSHPVTHQLTSAIPAEQCEHCHFQGGRIGLLFQGIREGGFGDLPEHAQGLGESRHNHGPDFYVVDEDTRNDQDETPPDLHFAAGLSCVDCHVGADVHGDGKIYSTAKFQVGIRCEDCHGTVREAIDEGEDGLFQASAGYPLRQLSRDESGAIVLTSKLDGRPHLVKQIKEILDLGANPRMTEAMGVNPETGFSHTDSLECYACHTGYRQSCFGCHVEVDDRFSMYDHQTGQQTQGLVQGKREFYELELFMLGTNERGKIGNACPSMQVFMSYIDETGEKVIDRQVRETASGKLGFGWAVGSQHTIQKRPQPCVRCHIDENESNVKEARSTYGFGSGEYFLEDGEGRRYDLTQILDEEGNPIVDFAHAGAGAVSKESIERALDVRVPAQD